MFLIVKLVEMGLGKFLNPDHRITALILVILSVSVGIAFYGFAALKTDLAQRLWVVESKIFWLSFTSMVEIE